MKKVIITLIVLAILTSTDFRQVIITQENYTYDNNLVVIEPAPTFVIKKNSKGLKPSLSIKLIKGKHENNEKNK